MQYASSDQRNTVRTNASRGWNVGKDQEKLLWWTLRKEAYVISKKYRRKKMWKWMSQQEQRSWWKDSQLVHKHKNEIALPQVECSSYTKVKWLSLLRDRQRKYRLLGLLALREKENVCWEVLWLFSRVGSCTNVLKAFHKENVADWITQACAGRCAGKIRIDIQKISNSLFNFLRPINTKQSKYNDCGNAVCR